VRKICLLYVYVRIEFLFTVLLKFLLRTVQITTEQWDMVLLIVIPWLKETSVFHGRRNKRLYTFAPLLNHFDNSSLFFVFPNIFLSSTPDLSGEFYGGQLIKIFIGISIFFTSDNCRVGLKLHVSHWVWFVFLRVLRFLLSVSFHHSIYPSSC